MANNDNYEYMRFLDLTGVQQIWNTAKQTFVQTVNGVGIDANGNVNTSGVNFPVGYIYLTTDNSTSPASLFGGTWQQLNSGNKCYIAGADVPIAPSPTKVDVNLVGDKLKLGFVNNGAWAQRGSDQYAIIQSSTGNLFSSNQGTVPAPYEAATPENLWAKISDSGHGVYMWKRVS